MSSMFFPDFAQTTSVSLVKVLLEMLVVEKGREGDLAGMLTPATLVMRMVALFTTTQEWWRIWETQVS